MVKPELVHEMEFTFWQNRFANIGLRAFVVAGGCVVVVGKVVTVMVGLVPAVGGWVAAGCVAGGRVAGGAVVAGHGPWLWR